MSSRARNGVDRLGELTRSCYVQNLRELQLTSVIPVKLDVLKGLDPAKMNAAERPQCLPGTRQDMQKNIIDWLMTPSNQNIMWLHGGAGLGKSTLTTTIAEYFRRLQRRGAFIFFDRNTPLESHPSRVICTLAYQLAQHDEGVRSAIATAIEQDPQLVTAPFSTQLISLICEPLSTASTHVVGPIVIIFDALDECGDPSSRRQILDLLSSQDFAKLPSQFRFLVTGRPEHDIRGALESCSHVNAVALSRASDKDMTMYIQHEVGIIYARRHRTDELPEGWPGAMQIERLVGYADGFFIWAATAMKLLFITEAPVKWLANLLLRDRQVITLHELYKTALLSVSKWEPGETTEMYRRILGMIIFSQIPLADESIADLLRLDPHSRSTCRTALRRLGCVIQWSEGQPARTLHKSFPDYLTNQSACASEPWFIDIREHQRGLALACLRIMDDSLHFNMGNLQTSHLANADVANLPAYVEKVISPSVSYSCRFWGIHLGQMALGDVAVLALVLKFFEQKFLYWLEVLSLLGEVNCASLTLISMLERASVSTVFHSNDGSLNTHQLHL